MLQSQPKDISIVRVLLIGLFEAFVQSLTRYSQTQRRNGLIVVGPFQRLINQQLFDLFKGGQLMGKADNCILCVG